MLRGIFAVLVGIQFLSAGPAAVALGAQTRPPSQVRPTEGEVTATQRAQGTSAQAPMSQAELVDRIRQSGLTREQARSQLARSGHDPSIVDPYFDAIEGGERCLGEW